MNVPRAGSRKMPLEGVRVLAVEQYGAGPWATLQLADMGAEVIKIEDPKSDGDVGRQIPPYRKEGTSLFFETFNRNKKSIALDIKVSEGRKAFERMVSRADIVFSNLRGDLPEPLGLTYEALGHFNPKIVCCSLSGFGMTGPRAAEAGYDYMMQGLAGWMSLTGEPDGPPMKSGLSLVDLSAGYVAAISMLAALREAESSGVGGNCDISLFETALAELMYIGTWVATEGYEPSRASNSAHPSIVPFQNFRTSDGWIVVACAKEKFWQRLCSALNRKSLSEDARFINFERRLENRVELLELLSAIFVEKAGDEWLELLRRARVPCAPVNDVKSALTDPQAIARGTVVEFQHPSFGTMRQVATPLKVLGMVPKYLPAPSQGEHTETLLSHLSGLTPDQIRSLDKAGAITLSKNTDPQ